MTLEEIHEIVRTVELKETLVPNTILVRGLTSHQLRQVILLAQSQLCELECRAPIKPIIKS